jgi:hypothetical protein
MNSPHSLHPFLKETAISFAPTTPPLPKALQLMHLYHEIRQWYCTGKLPKRPLPRYDVLLEYPFNDDMGFNLNSDIPYLLKTRYISYLFSAGVRTLQRDKWAEYVAERESTTSFDVALVQNNDATCILLFRIQPTDYIVINVQTLDIIPLPTIASFTAYATPLIHVNIATVGRNCHEYRSEEVRRELADLFYSGWM